MLEKIADFIFMGTIGGILVAALVALLGASIYGLYLASINYPLWTSIGILLFLACGFTGQRLIQGEAKK